MLPSEEDDYGANIIAAHAKAEKADLVVTLMDVWVLDPEVMGQLPWMAWAPIDHEPVPPAVKGMLEVARWPVAYSKFGHKAMIDAGLAARYVPHGVDTECFKPAEDRNVARASLAEGINNQHGNPVVDEDTFIVVMVAANKGWPARKAFMEVLQAWAEFSKGHPNVHLYLHTERHGVQGVPFDAVMELVGADPETITFAPQYQYATGGIAPQFLNTVYNAADVFLNPAYGEGFGLPTVEAQAAGCPVIVGDNTAQKELCFSGWKVDGLKHVTPQISYQWAPYVSAGQTGLPVYGIVEALEDALAWRGDKDMRVAARKGAEAYDVDLVVETYWQPLLNEIQEEIESGKRQAARVAARLASPATGGEKLPLVEKRERRREKKRTKREVVEASVVDAETAEVEAMPLGEVLPAGERVALNDPIVIEATD